MKSTMRCWLSAYLESNLRKTLSAIVVLLSATAAAAQLVISLPNQTLSKPAIADTFHFVSDGPIGPGWSRPEDVARKYFNEQLPAFFSRTLQLSTPVPRNAHLDWIFTGPHAGFTIELSATHIRLYQRYYDSTALYNGHGNYPEKIVRDDIRAFTGTPQTLTVVLDAHLAVQVVLNGEPIVTQTCVFDITRHQLMLAAPRTRHFVVAGSLLSEQPQASLVTVHPDKTYQTILGFGGSPSIPAYASLSEAGKIRYWKLLKSYNLLIDREYPTSSELKPALSNMTDLNDATPHYYGDNFPNGEVSSFDYSRHILALGGSVLYELWALPAWATVAYSAQNSPVVDTWNKLVRRVADPEKYAAIIVAYCRLAKDKTGSAPQIVGVENEVDQPPDVFATMTTTLRKRLDEAGFQSTRIQMADASYLYLGVERANQLRGHQAAWKATDYVAVHQYDFQQFIANPDLYDVTLQAMHIAAHGKPFLATEICLNDPNYQDDSYRVAFAVGELYHKDLTELDAEALMYCWVLLDVEQPSFGQSRSLFVPDRTNGNMPTASSFQLRVLGAFSRHLQRGMLRAEVDSNNPDLLASGYADSDQATLILLNRSTAAQRVSIDWPGIIWREIERTSTYSANQTLPASGDSVLIQPGQIITLSTLRVE